MFPLQVLADLPWGVGGEKPGLTYTDCPALAAARGLYPKWALRVLGEESPRHKAVKRGSSAPTTLILSKEAVTSKNWSESKSSHCSRQIKSHLMSTFYVPVQCQVQSKGYRNNSDDALPYKLCQVHIEHLKQLHMAHLNLSRNYAFRCFKIKSEKQ